MWSHGYFTQWPRLVEVSILAPGTFVRHPDKPEWGLGQVQSAIGERITVNFENAGKLLINGRVVNLETVTDLDAPTPNAGGRK